MPVFIAWFKPKKSAVEELGARQIVCALEASNARMATAKATLKFEEEMPESSEHYFAPKIGIDRVGLDRPALNVLDGTFMDTHIWNEELKEIEKIDPGPVEEEDPQVDFSSLSAELRIAILVKYGTPDILNSQIHDALDLTQADPSFDGHITEALIRTRSVSAMYPERILQLIETIRADFEENSKWPELASFAEEWVEALREDRSGALTKPAAPGKLKTPSGNTAGGGNVTDRNGDYEHNFETLGLEIALGLLSRSMDFNIYNLSGGTVKRAKEIIKLKEKPFPVWNDAFRNTPGILDYSRAMIIYTIKAAPDDIWNNPAELRSYINKTMTEADHAHPDAEMVAFVCGMPATTGERDEEMSEGKPQKKAAAEPDSKKDKPPVVEKADVKPAAEAKDVEATGVTALGDGKFSIDNLIESGQPDTDESQILEVPAAAADFQSIAEKLEKELEAKDDESRGNLDIWRKVMRTDPLYTKALSGTGFEGTSINAEYMIMRATEIFGPVGSGWGYEVTEDRMIPGAPLSEAIYEDKKFIGNRMLRDADGSLITELNHSIKIKFWYVIECDVRGEVEAYGATQYLYKTKHGIKCDGEAQKKSLTDAIKKALSLLGFSADVWLGLYDQPEYLTVNAIEFDIKNASDRAEDITRIRKELDEKFKQNTDTMRSAVTPNEVSGIASSLTRVMGVHLKAARDKADHEHAKYLESRLKRLEEIKSECLIKLQEKAA